MTSFYRVEHLQNFHFLLQNSYSRKFLVRGVPGNFRGKWTGMSGFTRGESSWRPRAREERRDEVARVRCEAAHHRAFVRGVKVVDSASRVRVVAESGLRLRSGRRGGVLLRRRHRCEL